VNDDERSGAPVTKGTDENVVKIKELVRSNHLLTCKVIADKLDMSKETEENYTTGSSHEKASQIVPRNFTNKPTKKGISPK
jgi:hypothetical protein